MTTIPHPQEGFWHKQIPLATLCLYRVRFGILLCLGTATWILYTGELFSNEGFHIGLLSRFALPVDAAFILCVLLFVSSLSISLGLFTRSSIAATLILRSFLYGMDNINKKTIRAIVLIVMVILLFSGSETLFSIDSRLRNKRTEPPPPSTGCAFPMRLLQLEFAQICFVDGITKMINPKGQGNRFFQNLNIIAGQ